MKKLIILALALSLVCASTTGCQATPGSSIVTEKDTNNLLSAAQGDSSYENTSKISEFVVSDNYQNSFENSKGNMKVNVDATVSVPDVDSMAIYSITERKVTQEELDNFISVLTKGEDIYNITSSQSYIDDTEEKLQTYKDAKAEGKTYMWEDSDIKVDDLIANAEATLTQLKANLTSHTIDTTMWQTQFGDKFEGTTTVDGIKYSIDYSNYEFGENLRFYAGSLNTTAAFGEATPPDYEITQERIDAISVMLEEIGFESMELVYQDYVQSDSCETGTSDAYRFVYTPTYDGTTSVFARGIDSCDSDAEYAALVNDEFVEVILTEDALAEVFYHCPHEVTGKEVEDVELLSFEEVCSVFEKMIIVKNSEWGDGLDTEFDIDSIVLGYKKIRTSAGDHYMMVPVWTFSGDKTECDDGKESGNPWTNKSVNETFLIINAIDGTVISDYVGY